MLSEEAITKNRIFETILIAIISISDPIHWSFLWMEQEFTDFSEFGGSDKSLKPELGSI